MNYFAANSYLSIALGAMFLGCDSGGGATTSDNGQGNPYADECAFACTGPEPCTNWPEEGACEQTCLAETEGQSKACADCIIHNVLWYYNECICSSTTCGLCELYVDVDGVSMGVCEKMCSSSDPASICIGYQIAHAADLPCRDTCAP